eukprot:scaffold39334_cov67-Cyclotella_meneghiniana.AAC.5
MLSFGRCLFFVNLVSAPAGVHSVKGRSQRYVADGGYDEESEKQAIQQAIRNSLEDQRHDKSVIDLTFDSPGTPSATSAEPPATSPAFAEVHDQLFSPEADLGSTSMLSDFFLNSAPVDNVIFDDVGGFDDVDGDGGAGVENTPPPAGTEEGDRKPAAKPRPQRSPSHQVTRAPPALDSRPSSLDQETRSGRVSRSRMTMTISEALADSDSESDSDVEEESSSRQRTTRHQSDRESGSEFEEDSDSDSESDSESAYSLLPSDSESALQPTPFRDITNRNLQAASRRQRTTRPQKKARTSRSTSSSTQASTQAASSTSSAHASIQAASTTSSTQASTQATSMTREDYIELVRDQYFEVHREEAPENYPLEMEVRRFSGRNQFTCQMCPNPDDRKRCQSHPNSHFLRLCAQHTPRCAMRDSSCKNCRHSTASCRGLCAPCLKLLLPAIYEEFRARENARTRRRYANDRRYRALHLLRGAAWRIKCRSSVGLSTLRVVGLPRNSLYFALLRLLCNERNCSMESLQKSFSDNPNDRRQIDHVEPLAQVMTRDYWVRNGYDVIPDQEERERRAGHWTVLDVIPEPENLANGDRLEGRLRWIEAEGRWRAVPGQYSRTEYTLADLEAADNDDDLNELDLDEDELWD